MKGEVGQGGELGGWGDDGVGRAGLKWFSQPLTPTTRYASLQMLGFNGEQAGGATNISPEANVPIFDFCIN